MNKNKRDKTLAPILRFPGFSGDWGKRKLGKISEVIDGDRGKNYPNGNELDEKGHTLFLSATNVTKNGFVFVANRYITEEKSNSMGNGKLVLDDIVLTSRGSIGNIAWYNETIQQQVPFARVNSGMLTLRLKNIVMPCFIAQFLKSPLGKKQIDLISFGSAQPQLTKKDVLNYIVSYPSNIEEQQQIGTFFKQLNDLIALNQCKLGHLQDRKKALLQQLFPQKGESVPQLRFPGFSGEWVERKLGDIGNLKNGMNFGKEAMGKGNPFVNLQNIFGKTIVDEQNLGLAESSNKQLQDYSLKKGDVLFIRSSVKPEGVGEAALVPNDFKNTTYSGFIIRFRPNLKMDNNYKRYAFSTNNVRNQIMAYATSSANTNINQDSLEKIIVNIPVFEEQAKIGSFLVQLDESIILHQRNLIHLQDQKKSLLQQLFI